MTDAELAKFLGADKDSRWPTAIKKLSPDKRAAYERMADLVVELELWQRGLGPKPTNVLTD